MSAVLKILQLNPFTPHDYFDVGYAQISPVEGLVWLKDCAGYREPIKRGIASLMVVDPGQPGFHRLAQEINPRAIVRPVEVSALKDIADTHDIKLAWQIRIDTETAPASRSEWADITGQDMWDHDNSRHIYLYETYDKETT